MKDIFTVRYYKSDLLLTYLSVAALMAFFIFILIFTSNKALAVLMIVLLAAMAVVMTVPTFLFYLKVDNDKMYVRSRSGKTYDFSLNDIQNIEHIQQSRGKYGSRFFLRIKTADNEVILHRSMKGFKELAAYLLNKYDSGEISTSVISKNCIKSLKQYIQ